MVVVGGKALCRREKVTRGGSGRKAKREAGPAESSRCGCLAGPDGLVEVGPFPRPLL